MGEREREGERRQTHTQRPHQIWMLACMHVYAWVYAYTVPHGGSNCTTCAVDIPIPWTDVRSGGGTLRPARQLHPGEQKQVHVCTLRIKLCSLGTPLKCLTFIFDHGNTRTTTLT